MNASLAREAAGFTVEQAAQRARVTADYLRAVERKGAPPYVLACRLSRLYGCSLDLFLKTHTAAKQRRSEKTHAPDAASTPRPDARANNFRTAPHGPKTDPK